MSNVIARLEQSSDGVTVRWAELPRPTEQLAAQLVPELQQLIADFRPDVLVCGSQGGYYVHRLWERGGCEVPTLMQKICAGSNHATTQPQACRRKTRLPCA